MGTYSNLLQQKPSEESAPVNIEMKNKERSSRPSKSSSYKRHRDGTTSSKQESKLANKQPAASESQNDSMIESIRSAVKIFGKEQTTHRLTFEEKKAILDIVYTYRLQQIKTSENEVIRIAANFIVLDYREHGKNSVLERVLKALNQ